MNKGRWSLIVGIPGVLEARRRVHLGFRVQDLGFKVAGLGFRVQDFGSRVYRVQSLRSMV